VTLTRLFVLHFILPFVILGLVCIHIGFLHEVGSSSSVPFSTEVHEYIPFYPYFILKDFFALILFLMVFSYFVFFEPNALGHTDNYIRANPLSTPAHIVPEWYFLPFYAMLRCIPHKFGGVLFMFGSILILFFLPMLTEKSKIEKFINLDLGGIKRADAISTGAVLYDLSFFF
jgi:ubiquinol-cytochrome c reductase cytochrome b subunit